MCFSVGTMGCGECPFNISIFDKTDGHVIGRRWLRGNPPSKATYIARELIRQMHAQSDGTLMCRVVQDDMNEIAGCHARPVNATVGAKKIWTGEPLEGTEDAGIANALIHGWALAFLSDDRTVVLYDAGIRCYSASGELLWFTALASGLTNGWQISADNDKVYLEGIDGGYCVRVYSGDDGSFIRRVFLDDSARTICAYDGDVFAADGSGHLRRYDSVTGARVGTGTLYLDNFSASGFSWARVDGEYVWTVNPTTSPDVGNSIVDIGDRDLARIVQIDVQTDIYAGVPFVTDNTPGQAVSVFPIADDGIYITTAFGDTHKIAWDKSVIWTSRTWPRIVATGDPQYYPTHDITVIGDRVYICHQVVPGNLAL